jgi:tRNA U34 5-methylaminomethyl-2-thiouridine-forming methyltransferase MnmC
MLKLVQTADGSNTIFNEAVGEHYHSRNGALQESRHVFVEAGLKYFLEQNCTNEVSVLEVGFGTGLNFLLSADECTNNNIRLNYTGIEAYPLTPDLISQTGYQHYISQKLWQDFVNAYPNQLHTNNSNLEIAACPLLD